MLMIKANSKLFVIVNCICRLCRSYDEMSDKVQEMPDNTSDLVALTQFVENASSVTVVNLQTAVDEAGERLMFLLEYATLPCMLAFLLI